MFWLAIFLKINWLFIKALVHATSALSDDHSIDATTALSDDRSILKFNVVAYRPFWNHAVNWDEFQF